MKYQELMKAIKNNEIAPVYLFAGEESYIAGMMEGQLTKKLIQGGMEQLNYTVFEDKNPDITEVVAVCETLPLMSQRRVVVLREETQILKTSDKTIIDRLEAYLKNPSPTTVLVVYDKNPDKRKKLYKAFKEQAQIVEYNKLNHAEFEKWIGSRWLRAGKKPSRRAVAQFIDQSLYLENSNKNMEMIDNELEKILDYVGGREAITPEDVAAVMPKSIEDNVFKMVDYAMGGKKGEALTMLEQFYLEGESPYGVFSLLIRQLRMMLMARCLSEKRLSPDAMARELKTKPFVAQKLLRGSGRYKTEGLRRRIIDAAKLDLMMKTGQIDPEFALEWYILKL
ncbi:MAG: DNA polymerase III subunit delta [Eubacterium sp.]|nr:DNA polymerase III subunit delta [Eubacterium sp.]